MKNVTSDKRNLWMFPLGTVGRDMIYNLFTNFIFTYILFTRHLTAAQLGAVTAIMVGARVFDALNDPVMGNIIERTRSRYGKFKPWLVIGILRRCVSRVQHEPAGLELHRVFRRDLFPLFDHLHDARHLLLGHGVGAQL